MEIYELRFGIERGRKIESEVSSRRMRRWIMIMFIKCCIFIKKNKIFFFKDIFFK